MTINTKSDALRDIEMLTDKMRQKEISFGIHAEEGYRIKYDIAMAWDGRDPAPVEMVDLANYLGGTPQEAKTHVLNRRARLKTRFRDSDVLKYDAKKEINDMKNPNPAKLRAAYKKHLRRFEAAMNANV